MNKTIFVALLTIVGILVSATGVLAFQPPVANAGPDLFLGSGQSAVLQGYGTGTNGFILNYNWRCDDGSLSNPAVPQPTYTAPYVIAYNPQAIYTCTIIVSDVSGSSNSDSAKIYVNYGNGANIANINVQTNAPTNVYSNQATLNGSFTTQNISANYAWFQYGYSTSYGTETFHQTASGTSGSFTQNLSSLFLNATYHYRAVVQDIAGNKFYGQDMIFVTNQGGTSTSNGYLNVSKKVINLSSGNLVWSSTINASPSDVLSFSINLQANGQNVRNVIVKDVLPANLIYKGTLTVNGSQSYVGDLSYGINIGTIAANQTATVTYQAQVAPSANFPLGATNLANAATITSTEAGAQTASANVVVNKSLVYGATTISTGLTNYFWADSLLPALLMIVAALWLYYSGLLYSFADWLKTKIK